MEASFMVEADQSVRIEMELPMLAPGKKKGSAESGDAGKREKEWNLRKDKSQKQEWQVAQRSVGRGVERLFKELKQRVTQDNQLTIDNE